MCIMLLAAFVVFACVTMDMTCAVQIEMPNDPHLLNEIDELYANIETSNGRPLDWRSNIDFVIPSSLGSAPSKVIERTRTDDHSLYWVLVSISKNAPWIRNIYILVDGTPDWPYILPTNINVFLVNRCKYMKHCPTQNSFAVQTMIHKIPGLSEHFIVSADDIVIGRPVSWAFYFTEDGKPYSWRDRPTWSDGIMGPHHRIYVNPEVFKGKTPTSAGPPPHFQYPLLKSFAAELAQEYSEWYAFVESHQEGRFSSELNSCNMKRNSQEENFDGVWGSMLITSGRGVHNPTKNTQSFAAEVHISKAGFARAIQMKPFFMNIQDRFSKDPVLYRKQIRWFWSAMEKLFGISIKFKNK